MLKYDLESNRGCGAPQEDHVELHWPSDIELNMAQVGLQFAQIHKLFVECHLLEKTVELSFLCWRVQRNQVHKKEQRLTWLIS